MEGKNAELTHTADAVDGNLASSRPNKRGKLLFPLQKWPPKDSFDKDLINKKIILTVSSPLFEIKMMFLRKESNDSDPVQVYPNLWWRQQWVTHFRFQWKKSVGLKILISYFYFGLRTEVRRMKAEVVKFLT